MTTHSRMARNSSLKELWLARILKQTKSSADGGEEKGCIRYLWLCNRLSQNLAD